MKSIELFTGAGGLALGTHLAGFHHSALFEWNRDACKTLAENARRSALPGIDGWRVVEGDVRSASFEPYHGVDLVAGGVPCQPFSIGGKHKGMRDDRNMFPEFVRAVRTLAPRAFIVENVKGLLRESFRSYFGYVVLQLTYPELERRPDEAWTEHMRRLERVHTKGSHPGLRYNVVFELLNSADYGVPQTRERVFIVGFRADLGINWSFPVATHSKAELVKQQEATGEYWTRHGLPRPPGMGRATKSIPGSAQERDLFPVQAWRTVRDAISDLPEPGAEPDRDFPNHQLNPGARRYPGHTGSPIDWPAKTLKAGVHGVPGGENMIAMASGEVRYFTVREAARIQTFPDRWLFEGSWSEAMRQLGNAVPVSLAAVVASSVKHRLEVTQ